jgi:hypothetical protein
MVRYVWIVLGGLVLGYSVLPLMLLFTGGRGDPVVGWTTILLCVVAVWEASKPVHRPYAMRIAILIGTVVLVTMFLTIPATIAATTAIGTGSASSLPYVQVVVGATAVLTFGAAVWMRRRSAGRDASV